VGDEAQKMHSVAAANQRNVENVCLYKRLLFFVREITATPRRS
jgi:hypothetical protein